MDHSVSFYDVSMSHVNEALIQVLKYCKTGKPTKDPLSPFSTPYKIETFLSFSIHPLFSGECESFRDCRFQSLDFFKRLYKK